MSTESFSNNQKRLEKIKDLEGLKDEDLNLLLRPVQVKQADLKTANGSYSAWRIIFNNSLGPGKGGIRFHPDASEDEVKSLAFWMGLKNSLAGIPYGGAKGGVKIDTKNITLEEKEEVSREYVRNFGEFLGQDKDVPAPDMYTDSQTMAWMLDEYEKSKKQHEPGMITGKPLVLGGAKIRQDATSKGGYIVTKKVIEDFNLDTQDLKIVIQGFGNAGANIARMFSEEGYKIIAVSDSSGGLFNENGLDIKEIERIKQTDRFSNYTGDKYKNISNNELLELEADILVLAAMENQITESNAKNIKANYLLELANGPITFEADEILFSQGNIVIPDILANSGGVIASYLEWSQNKTGNILSDSYLEDFLQSKMKDNWKKVYELYQAKEKNIDLRASAYILAIRRILEAERFRGRVKK